MLACGRPVVIRCVFGSDARVVVHVMVGSLCGHECNGARRSYRKSNESERESEMGQGAKQAHGRQANGGLQRAATPSVIGREV